MDGKYLPETLPYFGYPYLVSLFAIDIIGNFNKFVKPILKPINIILISVVGLSLCIVSIIKIYDFPVQLAIGLGFIIFLLLRLMKPKHNLTLWFFQIGGLILFTFLVIAFGLVGAMANFFPLAVWIMWNFAIRQHIKNDRIKVWHWALFALISVSSLFLGW